ncbi:MAG: hypothetical protein LPK00_07545 [Bacillaceae bacterium]|nr:hypothetical protein [Bacillaceae bacterium]
MTFADILRKYVGRNIEVFLPNQFLEGTLISVGTDSFILQTRNGTYVDPTQQVTIFLNNVDAIRVPALVA